MKKTFLAIAALAALALSPGTASAATYIFTNVGDSYTLDFNGMENNVDIPGLSGSITYTLTAINGFNYDFGFTVSNTSTAPVTASRISTFGFNTTPDFVSASILSGSVFTNVSSGNVPGGLPNVEFCATAGPNCSGGGGGGVTIGNSNSGLFRLTFGSAPGTVEFTNNYDRYQAITAPGISGGSAVGVPTTSPVPEPASWMMMLAGFTACGITARRRKTTLRLQQV